MKNTGLLTDSPDRRKKTEYERKTIWPARFCSMMNKWHRSFNVHLLTIGKTPEYVFCTISEFRWCSGGNSDYNSKRETMNWVRFKRANKEKGHVTEC